MQLRGSSVWQRRGSRCSITALIFQSIPRPTLSLVLHNFIRINDPTEVVEPLGEDTGQLGGNGAAGFTQSGVSCTEVARANKKCDEIAQAMWDGYIQSRH